MQKLAIIVSITFSFSAIQSLSKSSEICVERLCERPIITPDMVPNDPVVNVNGPSIIKAPSWLKNRLGNYYLYFANHRGPYIHLAVSDELMGPWCLVDQDPLSIFSVSAVNSEVPDKKSHVASPDIYVDEERHTIRMYFHFKLPKLGHLSSVAESHDGLHFTPQKGTIGKPYMRHFIHDGFFYLIDRRGRLIRSKDGLTDFEVGHDQIFMKTSDTDTHAHLRHTGLRKANNMLEIYFSRVGDAPESIMLSTMKLDGDWRSWQPSQPQLVIKPETIYEGADLEILPSRKGDAKGRLRQLRDPAILEENGQVYLLYSVAGEHGISIAKIN